MVTRKKLPLLPLIVMAGALALVAGAMFFRLYTMGYFSKGGHLPVYTPAPDFSLTDQEGKTVRRADLEGRVWVADFIFTRCPGPCPLMSVRAKDLVGRVKNFKMVSFTSDPAFDTPAVLKEYGQRYGADPSRWFFLTGPQKELSRIASEFNFGGIDAPDMHTTRFVLIDKQGQVRGYYDTNDPEHLARLTRDLRSLS